MSHGPGIKRVRHLRSASPGAYRLQESDTYLNFSTSTGTFPSHGHAGMAHSLEIRTPLVDATLLARLAHAIAGLSLGEGKRALAHAPSLPLPDRLVARAKTGFGVPTGAWLDAEAARSGSGQNTAEPKGLVSRRWSQVVLAAASEEALASKTA